VASWVESNVFEGKVIPEYTFQAMRWSKFYVDTGSTTTLKADDRTDAGWR
jgi:hypothetical protein